MKILLAIDRVFAGQPNPERDDTTRASAVRRLFRLNRASMTPEFTRRRTILVDNFEAHGEASALGHPNVAGRG